MKEYKTIYEFGSDETIIEKSTFIGYALPVETEEEAIDFIKEIKVKHKDATHNVWAYIIGKNMEIQRYSDDGEPSGTAGIPALEVLKKEELKNLVVVITRYFGGIKLGAGGLVRAYIKGCKIGIESAKIVSKIPYTKLKIKIDYSLLGKVQNYLMNNDFIIADTLFEDMVTLVVYIKTDEKEALKEKIVDLLNGNLDIIENEEFYLSHDLENKIIRDF